MESDMKIWRESIKKMASSQLMFGFPDGFDNKDCLDTFLNFGIAEITKRRKLKNDTEFLSGQHDYALVRFIVRSYNEGGIEGAYSASSLGTTKNFTLSPIAELQQSVRQVI